MSLRKTRISLALAAGLAGSAAAAPEVILDSHPEWIALRERAIGYAKKNMKKIPGWRDQMTCMPQWDRIWLWDSCFMSFYAGLAPDGVNGLGNLDNLYAMQGADGRIAMAYDYATRAPAFGDCSNPPLCAWVEWEYARRTGDRSRLERAYAVGTKLFGWFKANRRHRSGLYWFEDTNASGLDNSPRSAHVYGLNGNTYAGADRFSGFGIDYIDLSCQQVLAARSLAKIAKAIGRAAAEASEWEREADGLSALINERLWNDRSGFYHDGLDHGYQFMQDPRKTICGFWPLVARVADAGRAARLVKHLEDPEEFATRHPVPTLSRDDINYDPKGCFWRGGVWAPTNYMVVKGLKEFGYHALAREIACRHLSCMAELLGGEWDSVWECYAPECAAPATRKNPGEYARKDFVGWGGLGPIVMLVEDVLGLEIDALENKIVWRVKEKGRQGVRNIPYNGGRLTLVGDYDENGKFKYAVDAPCAVDVVVLH